MDFSFLTFSPPKRNSKIPQLGCKRRKSKSPVTAPQNWQAVHKTNFAQKISIGGCRPHLKHTSRGKENREKVSDNHLTSKLCSPIKNIGKKVLFKPCRRTNCNFPKRDVTPDSSIIVNNQSNIYTSDVSSHGRQDSIEMCRQQDSLVTSSVEIIDEGVVMVPSDTSCSVGDIREALKLISVGEKGNATGDSSVCIVSESVSSFSPDAKGVKSGVINLADENSVVVDSSNIVPNTSSSDLSDMKTPMGFTVRKITSIFCTEPRAKAHRARNIRTQLDSGVLAGNKISVGASTFVDSVLVGNKINVVAVSNSQDGVSKEEKSVNIKHQLDKFKGKSRPMKPYKASLQNNFRQCLLHEVCDSRAKDECVSKNKFLMEINQQSSVCSNLPHSEMILSSKHNGDDVIKPSYNSKLGDQSEFEVDTPLAISTPVLSAARYRAIENWLNANDFSGARESLPDSRTDHSCLEADSERTSPNRTDDVLSVSAVEVLNSVYGNNWYSADIHKKCHTEPVQKHKCVQESESLQIKCVKPNGQTKRSPLPSSDEEDNLSEFLKRIYFRRKPNKPPPHQLLHTPEFIDDNSLENSPTQYLKSQSKDVKIDVKKTCRILQESSGSTSGNSDVENCIRRLNFSNTVSGNSEKSVHREKSVYSEKSVRTEKSVYTEKIVGTCTKKTAKDVKRNKKVLAVKVNEIKKPTEVTTFVRKEEKICTRSAYLHTQPALSFLASLSVPTPDGKCDPEARYFKKNFSKLKESLGKKLFQIFNEKVFENKLPHDMSLQWNVRMKQTAGYCYSKRTLSSTGEKIRTSRIVLSTKVIATPDRLRDTLIHEMCHAAAWILDMARDGHGPRWKAWVKKATAVFPELPPIRRCHDYNIHTKFTYRCMGCGYSFGRHSKSLNLTVKRCGYCFGEFELLVNTKNKAGIVVQAPKLHRSPRGFARFVKDNYNTVKKAQPGLKHGDVMKLLSEQFKTKHQKSTS